MEDFIKMTIGFTVQDMKSSQNQNNNIEMLLNAVQMKIQDK